MEEPPKNALRVKIMEPFLNAGLFRAHIYPYGSVPYETRQFLQLTDEMKKESAKLRRLLSIPKENEFVAVYSSECNDWFRGYIVRTDHSNSGLLAKVFLIDYGAFLQDIPYHYIYALPFEYSVNVLDSQAFKIALFGVNPRGIQIGAKHCSFVRQTRWLPSHTLFISNLLKNACKIYFQKVCQRDEIHFGYIFVQQNDKWISLHDILVREGLADAGDSELEFINKEIPTLMKRYRLTGEFDNTTSVRRKLYPNLPVDDKSDISNVENSLVINQSDEDSIAVSSKTESIHNGYEESINSNAMSSSDTFSESGCPVNGRTDNAVRCSDISSDGEQSVALRNREEEAFSEDTSESEVQIAETAAVFNVNDLTLKPVDTDHHVDNIFMLGHDDKHYFCAASQFSNSDLDTITLEMLERLKVRDLTQCQKYMIPAMLTGKNITLIDSPKSGKTSAYLISLISLLRMKSNDPTEFGVSPKSVIVCPYSSRCESIHDECWRIISGHKEFPGDTEQFGIRANLAYGCGSKLERDKLIELSKGYDVLVCTPRFLLRLIQNEKNEFNLNKMSHIVFDEFHILLEAYFNEVAEILQYVNTLKKKPVQRIIISNLWNVRMKDLVEKDVLSRTGFVLIPCYLEAALFVHIVSELKYFSNEEKKVGDIFHLVSNQTRGKSVVIVLDVDDDVEVVYSKLNKCDRLISRIKDLHVLERERALCFKKQIAAGLGPVLICTDYVLGSLRIYEADCLIHYSLPKSKSVFNFRFSVLLNRLQAAANEMFTRKKSEKNSIEKPETYIYINTSNQVQFPLVLDIMKKLHANVPKDIETLVKRVAIVKEIESKKNVDFCINLRQFGRCVNEKLCEYRHVLTIEKDIPDPLLPKSGEVQVHITHVYSPTYFRVRLLKHKTENGEWTDVRTPDPTVLSLKLNNYFRNPDNVRCFEYNEETQNDIVAVHLPIGSGTYTYERAKILKVVETREINKITGETKPKTVRIRCVDSGFETVINISNIVKLPPHLMSIAEATVDAFVCNLLPIDEDNTWGIIFRQLIDKKIQECAVDKKNKFIGTVKLVIGRSIWLDPFGCYRYFDYLKEHYLKFSISKYLLENKLAVKNEYHLKNLFDKCKEAGLEIDNEVAVAKMVECVSISEKNVSPEKNGVRDTDTVAALDVPNEDSTKSANSLNSVTKNEEHIFRKPVTPEKKRVTSKKNCITKPMMFWKQDNNNIYLTIMENIDENYVCTWEDQRISFEGRVGSKIYKFDEYLYACIDCENVSHRKSGVTIVIKLPKLVKTILWRRLLKNREPQKWIKLDPNVISSDDSETDYSEVPEKYFSGPASSPPRNCINNYRYPEGYESELTSDIESDTDSKLFEW